MPKDYKPGSIVKARGRSWVVLPSNNKELLIIKPLGGSEEETTAIYLPLLIPEDKVEESSFPKILRKDLGDFYTARLLYNASKLSFRNVSGPFRCMGKLSFRPRSYQMVPLVTALKQEVTRLLIADDVGIGKTIEALMILRELMERGEVKRFAVICLPHLCEQWHSELKDKLDIEAEIIRSSTAAALDRKYPGDYGVFHGAPYQVISVDYIKASRRKDTFINFCPEMIIVDEAHTCARPSGAKNNNVQQRFSLLKELSKDPQKHILLLTATPHSGKDDEFTSLLGLLNPNFDGLNLEEVDPSGRKEIAKYFIQRKRGSIIRWLKETTSFPIRDAAEVAYNLHPEYLATYISALKFAQGISKGDLKHFKNRIRYWAALALLRGIMSSPAAGLEMLRNRSVKRQDEIVGLEEEIDKIDNPTIEDINQDSDVEQSDLLEQVDLKNDELDEINFLSERLQKLTVLEKDFKAQRAITVIKQWLKEGYNPIIFCRYISTAKYLGALLKNELPRSVELQVITSELADEQRRERIDQMEKFDKRVLVATDCLSEGINLQKYFSAVFHYDLPWNPNRIEQREGRVDRFGQAKDTVKTYLLWGKDNPIDNIVLNVLIRKVRDIQKATGVTMSLGDNDKTIMDTVLKEVLLNPAAAQYQGQQLSIGFSEEITKADTMITNEFEAAKEKAERIRSIFEHATVKPEDIEKDLEAVDEAIGDPDAVRDFVVQALQWFNCQVENNGVGYEIFADNLPDFLKVYLTNKVGEKYLVSFTLPTPTNYQYLGRNHRFVEQLCQLIIALAFEERPGYQKVARTAVIRTDLVNSLTVLVQFRVRNVIKEVRGKTEVIAEEMHLWGYRPTQNGLDQLSYETAKQLLVEARSLQNIHQVDQEEYLADVLEEYQTLEPEFLKIAEERADKLVEAHGRFKKYVGDKRYEAVYPVLPPDVLGMYILLPKPQAN